MAMRASALRLPSRLLLLKSATLCNATAIIRSRNIFCAAKPNVAGPQPVPRLQSTFPPLHHAQVRFRSWTELKDCKHWLITLKFPDPKPAREEMINTYVKTLANVLGSEEEAKKKIYALSTTVYTGFQCNIDEATSEKLKEQPLVDWVLPDGYGDPELGIFGGDRYNNGVVTPDPNPPRPYRERQREMNYDRRRYDGQRDFRGSEGARGRGYRESGGYGARPAMENEGSIQRIPMQDDRRGFQPGDSFSRRGPIQNRSQGEWYPASDERRESQPGAAQDYRPSYSQRVVQGEQRQHPGFEGGSTWRKSD